MNHTLTLALAILLLAATGRGETNLVINVHEVDNPVIKAFVSACSTNGFDTSGFIRKLAASGEICRVLGFHCWEYLPSNENVFSLPGQEKRHKCRICGKVETKTEVWK